MPACTYGHTVQWGIHLNPCLPCLGSSCQVVKFIPHPFWEVDRDRPCSCVRTVYTHVIEVAYSMCKEGVRHMANVKQEEIRIRLRGKGRKGEALDQVNKESLTVLIQS